ncbi:MAG: hypothetical protein SGJ10_13365 [Bacteroidota bacterium]|nr:hypothetical protein [Bacteroidota bacterium]
MTEELISEGKCLFCEAVFPQKEIGKHLAKHLAEMQKADVKKSVASYCHIQIEIGEMFLQILAKSDTEMEEIGVFLRNIWLEFCGHMSGFDHKDFEIEMEDLVETVFENRTKLSYDYDYGTTTSVFLKGLKKYSLFFKESIILLSRNEPLNLMCATCNKEPAVFLCSTCYWKQYAFYCKKCSTKHKKVCDDFADYSKMPVVNSPRMGQCGYEGGRIDKNRDGTYKSK